MQNIRLLLEYDGTAYAGWQRQHNLPSVQAAVEGAIMQMTGATPEVSRLTVAGRTDAGVHALGQVANFRTARTIAPRRFATGLNFWLPPDIRVHRADGVPDRFDARRWALGKVYRYRIYVGPHPLALDRHRTAHVRGSLDVTRMREAASHLIGERDFESFRSVHCDAAHAVRRMAGIDIDAVPRPPLGTTVDIVLRADAFCRHMCRIIAGSLLQVGRGQAEPGWIACVLAQRKRAAAGMTAVPCGLTLVHVAYPPNLS